MKNQYFGDVHDYRKYGLLRLLDSTGLTLGVGWMLTADDDGPDGQMKSYLSDPEKWRNHDPLLYEFLKGCQSGIMVDGVALIEQSGLLGDAHFFSEIVPDGGDQRKVWGANLIARMEGRDVVFPDADNGMMIASKRVGQKNSSKYTDWAEVEALLRQGSSVLIYQDYPHENRDSFRQRLAQLLRETTGADEALLFSTSHVLFTLLIQDRHSAAIHDALDSSLSDWEGQITLIREASKSPTELIAQRIIHICEANGTWYDQCRETWVQADEILGVDIDWIEDMLGTEEEHNEVREALKAGSVSDALAITAQHFEWQQEEQDSDNNVSIELVPSLAQALAAERADTRACSTDY